MNAEGTGQGGRVGVHIVHRLHRVPEQTDARAAQSVQYFGDIAPFGEGGICRCVPFERADDAV